MTAYLIADIEVKDPGRFEQYRRDVKRLVEKHGGEYLVRGGEHETLEGKWKPGRLVLFRFPSRRAIHEFYYDAEYEPLKLLRHQAAESNIVVVEGL